MNWLTELSSSRIVVALGWTLLHSLWICTAIAVMLKVLLAGVNRASAATRYSVCCASFVSLAILLGMTFQHEMRLAPSTVTTPESSRTVSVIVSSALQPEATDSASRSKALQSIPSSPPIDVNAMLIWIVLAWVAGATALSTRLLGGWLHVHRLRRQACAPPSWCDACIARIAGQVQIAKSVRVLLSSAIDVPCVIGWLKPVVLMPPAMLSGLSIGQIETIFAHELAHIARNDYLANILQSIAETLLFYHPAVWWISHRLRVERENCCDDVAVGVCGNKVVYARALEAIEMLRIRSTRLAVAADGADLLPRIRRLAVQKKFDKSLSRWPAGAVIMSTLLIAQIVASCAQQRAPNAIAATTRPTSIATQPAAAVAEPPTFETVYKLEPGEVAKFIPAPFLPDRWVDIYGSPPDKGQVIFHLTKTGELRRYSISQGTGSLGSALHNCGLQRWEAEATEKTNPPLLYKVVDGDWIFREDASREEKLDAVVKILAKRIPGFQLQPRFVQRDVLLAKGSFHPEQHPNLNLGAPGHHGETGGGGTGTIDAFLNRIGEIAGTRVIDQTEPFWDSIVWREDVSVSLYKQNGERLYPRDVVLGEIEKETGLKFVPAKQRETIYFVSMAR